MSGLCVRPSLKLVACTLGFSLLSGMAFAEVSCPATSKDASGKTEALAEVQVVAWPAKEARPAGVLQTPALHPDEEAPIKGGLRQVWNINPAGRSIQADCYYGGSNKPVSVDVTALKHCTAEITTKGVWNSFSCD